MFDNVWLIPLFPLIGFLINGLFGKKIKNEKIIGAIGSLMVFCSFAVACHDISQPYISDRPKNGYQCTDLHLDQIGEFSRPISPS